MAYDIGTARGVIEMMYNGRGVATAKADLTGLQKSGQVAQKQITNSFKAMGLGGFALATAIGYVIHTSAEFEKRMSAIAAVSGATGEQMDALREKALQLGADTVFSASEAASAIEELVKAGIPVADVLNGAADAAVALAAAGGVSIPEAATIAANAMNQFNLAAQDLGGVVDSIAGAANASAVDVSELGQSLQQVGAVANLAGLSFNDTATAIALMGNAGIKGSDAGTSLKSMLQRLQPVTKKQALEFKALGLITEDGSNKFFDAQGNVESYANIAGVLSNSLKGMTQQQKLAALQVLFGSDAIRAAAVAADAGRKGVKGLNEEMGKTTAAEVAATRMDNFSGSLEQLKGSLDTAIILAGSAALPILRDFVDFLTKGVNAAPALASTIKGDLAPGFGALFDAIGDVITLGIQIIDMFDGIAGSVVKLGLEVVVGTFTALAFILDTVTGLLEGQAPIIAIALGAWILLANGGIGLVISRLGTLAAFGVIKALDGLMALQAGAATTTAELRVLAVAAAEATASIAAVALIVAAIIIWNSWKQAVKDTQQALEDAAKAQSSGNFEETQSGLEAINKEIAKRKKLIDEVDVKKIGDIGMFLENSFNPTRWGDVAKLGEYKDTMDELEATAAGLADTMVDMGTNLGQLAVTLGIIDPEEATALMDGLSNGDPAAIEDFNSLLGELTPLLTQAGITTDEFNRALADSGSLLGGISFRFMANELLAVAQNSDTAAGGQQTLAAAAAEFSNEALSATDAAKALDAALDNLIGVQLSADQAGIKWRDGLRKLREEIAKTNGSIKEGTPIGDANRAMYDSQIQTLLDLVTAQAKAGDSIGSITKTFKNGRQELIDTAVAAGTNKNAFIAMLREMNLTPKAVRTLVEAVGVDRAQKHVEKLTAKYHLTPEQVTTIFTAAGAESAAAKVKALRDYIKTLKGKNAPVTAPGSVEAEETIKQMRDRIKELKPKAVDINAPGSKEAADQIATLKQRIDDLRNREVYIDVITRHFDQGGGGAGGGNSDLPPPVDPSTQRMLPGQQGNTPSRPSLGTLPPKSPRTGGPSERGGAGAGSGNGREPGLRLISGRLTLDKQGRAFIRGIAEEAVADGNSYGDTLDRMG